MPALDIVAHLVASDAIKDALITTPDNPGGAAFTGVSATDQTATVQTNANGRLLWALDLDTENVFTSWKLFLTKKGDADGSPDDSDTTDHNGTANPTPGGVKQF